MIGWKRANRVKAFVSRVLSGLASSLVALSTTVCRKGSLDGKNLFKSFSSMKSFASFWNSSLGSGCFSFYTNQLVYLEPLD